MTYFFSAAFFKTAAIAVIVFVILDLLWLSVIARPLYFKHLSYLAEIRDGRIVFNLPVGLSVQVIIALGLAVFVSLALLVQNSLGTAVLMGVFSGFVLYCTYDLTNLSFVKGYPVSITLVDIAWGSAQGLFSGLIVFYLSRYFGNS